jgi:phosphatidylglycerol---prolipoprotein diacylglyceryl transferase
MLAIAVIVCTMLIRKDAKAAGLREDIFSDLVFWCAVSGIFGARIFFILMNGAFFAENPIEMIMLQHGGLAWQGGLIGGALAGIYFVRKNKLPLTKTLDLAAPYLALGQSIGRIGCFLNGCCYGKEVAWGVYFPALHYHAHPTQIYDTVGLFIIFLILKNLQRRNLLPGNVFVLYLVLAPLLRFVIEFFRADHTWSYLGLSIYQYVCLFLITIAVILYANIKSRSRT